MMPLALLLTPDDQAVGAITSVLEEMGVTWERPRDGASAATRLHSGNVDLVLVDCENLPAAKLILDVCRRTKTGRTLVGIAIADGRTGLPMAFRLGAEFILTRPVAKDQVRTTIRAALNRSKKAATGSGTAPENSSAPDVQANHNLADSSLAAQSLAIQSLATQGLATQAPAFTDHTPADASSDAPAAPKTMTMAASGESPWREIRFTASSATTAMSAAAHDVSETVPGQGTGDQGMATAIDVMDSEGDSSPKDLHSDDLVWAEIERTERENKVRPADSAASGDAEEEGQEKKGSGLVVALLLLAQLCSGCYAAWITQPKLRTFLQPHIERVRTLIGIGNAGQASTGSLTPGRVVGQPNPAPAQFKPTDNAASAGPTRDEAKPMAAASEKSVTPEVASPQSPSGTMQSPGISTSNSKANSGGTTARIQGDEGRIAAPNAIAQTSGPKPSESVHPTTAAAAASETGGVVLSSKGAEKRLLSSVPPQYQPSMAKTATRSEGAVVLIVSVDTDGKVANAQVTEGQSDFANAAVAAVRHWRYRPYMRDGIAVPFETVVQISPPQP